MGLSDLYYKLEEKYYASLDWFDSKGLHFFYKIDEWFNSKNIPSFPIMTLLSVVILAAIIVLILFLAGAFGVPTVNVTMKFVDVSNNVAVPSLPISLLFNGEELLQTTNANGELELSLPKDVQILVNISSDKYALQNNNFIFSQDDSIIARLTNKDAMFGPKTLHLYTDLDSKALFSGIVEVDLTCTENPNYIEKKTVVDGIVDVTDLPNDCGELQINSAELGLSQTITASNSSLDVLVSGKEMKTGLLRVIVQDETGSPLKDISVVAFSDDDVYSDSKVTQETGLVEFNLVLNKYYLSASDSGIGDYSPMSTKDSIAPISGCYDMLKESEPTVCTITMKKSNVGKINLLITDVSGQPVKEAQIKIYKNEVEFVNDSLKEDAKGVYQKGMPELGPYRVVVDSVQYMIYDNSSIMVSDTATPIVLEAIKASPVLSVIVTANNEPVANATVQLMKEGNLLITKNTGADGIAFFDRLETGKVYNAKVIKGDYSQTSQPITLDARLENKLNVQMVIGKGQVDLSVLDKQGNPVSGAQVELYNLFTEKSIGSLTQTDATGLAHFYGISADKTVYAKITTSKGTSYSLASEIIASQIVTLTAYASDDSTNFSMDLIGVYNKDGSEINTLPRDVVASNEYYALFLMNVPKGKPYTSGNVFFIGNGKIASESDILIKSSESIFGVETKGLTYTPKKGYAEDMLNKTSDDALWSSLNISKINAGQTLVKVNFIVSNDPKLKLFNLGYRASLKTGSSILRYPIDTELGQNESVSDKLGFYADTEKISLKVGDLVCVDVACVALNAQDDLGNITQIYNDDLYSTYNSATVMSFKIVPATKQLYKNVTLEVKQANAGLDIKTVSALLNGKTILVDNKAGKYSSLVSAFTPTSTIDGSISFIPSKAGETILTISLIGEDKTILFTKDIKVVVDSPKNLVVEYLPTTIVPYVLNLGAVIVNNVDENMPVEDAIVNVFLNDIVVASGKTDFDGKLPVQISKPNAGDILKIVVSAAGYNENVTSIKITENILVPNKPEVSITVEKSESEFVNTNLLLFTTLPYTLKVKRIGFSANEFSDYLNLKITNVSANKTFDGNLDLNINAELTDLGKALLEPKEFKANLEIVVSSEDLDKTWNVVIPITIYIKMFDSLDATNCLSLALGDFSAKEFNFKLTNTCLSSGKAVNLYNAKVYAEWVDNKLGDFIFNNKKLDEQDENFIVIPTVKPKGTNNTVNTFKLGFVDNPAIVSGMSKVNIVVNAYYPTETGLQEITTTKELTVSISDYEKCLQIISPSGQIITTATAMQNPIVLGVTQYGMGMSMLGGMYNPMLQGMTSANGYPLGMGNMMGMGGAATYMNNGMQDYSGYYGTLNLQNSADPTAILAMQQQAQMGAYGTTDNYNSGLNGFGNNQLGMMNNGYNGTYNSGMMGYNQPTYSQNPGYVNPAMNSRYGAGNAYMNGLNGYGVGIMQKDYLPVESKILFDLYPASPLMTGTGIYGGMPGQYGMGMQGAYGMQSAYGMGQFGAMMPQSLLPPYNKLTIKNQCNDNVDIEVRAMPQIYVNPTTITIPSKKSGDITVMSSSLPGTYTMNVLAGASGSGNLLPLISIPVNVIDYASNTAGPDCFKLSEEPTINMSSAYKRNKLIKVYNYCYSKGVIFDEAKPVEEHNLFTRKEVVSGMQNKSACTTEVNNYNREHRNDKDYRQRNLSECNGITINQNMPYVIVTPIGVPQVEYSGTYGQYQVIDVMLEKDPTIQRIVYEQMTRGTSMGDSVSKLSAIRSSLADLYNNVEFPALFVINARIGYGPTGIQRSIQKMITVRDLWNLAGAVDILEGVAGGNKACTPDKWTYGVPVTESIAAGELKNVSKDGTARIPFEDGYQLLDKNCFGTGDGIKFDKDSVVKTIGDAKVEIKPIYSDFKIHFDLKLDGCFKDQTVDTEFEYVINSFNFSDAPFERKHKILKLSFKFNNNTEICYENGIQTTTDNGTTDNTANTTANKWCSDNYGSDWKSLSSYGFGQYAGLKYGNMLNFNYDTTNVSEIADCSKNFCDAEQLRYYLNSNKVKFNSQSINDLVNTNVNGVTKADFLKGTDKNIYELNPKDVLDSVSNYFLTELQTSLLVATIKNNIQLYTDIINDMPNLFFKVKVNKGECKIGITETTDVLLHNDVSGALDYCYYKAQQFKSDEPKLMKFITDTPEFDLVILRQVNASVDNLAYYALNDSTRSTGNTNKIFTDLKSNAYVVYLKPDNYKAGLENDAFKAAIGAQIFVESPTPDFKVKTPGVYVVYPYIGVDKKNHIILFRADQYMPIKDTTNNFLYNLPIDPNGRSTSYTGEFGVCIEKGKLILSEILNKNLDTECKNSLFGKITDINPQAVELITINNIKVSSMFNGSDHFMTFDMTMPNCANDCKVTTTTSKTISYTKEKYYLTNIFKKPNEYCYNETSEKLEIKYGGFK